MIHDEREARALARWRPGQRWYHPAMARLVITTSRFITHRMNRLDIMGRERLDGVRERGGRGLLTISNHVSLFDDPILVSSLVSGPYRTVRWIGADALNFFGSRWKAWLFTAGKSVPIVRGAGLEQPGMDFLRDRLHAGDWVHMFPEGGRTRDAQARMAQEFRSGIGWLIDETRPLVLPFYHYGMQMVLPVGANRPRGGNDISVLFGDVVDCDEAWISETVAGRAGKESTSPQRWDAIAAEMRERVGALERQLHPAFTAATADG